MATKLLILCIYSVTLFFYPLSAFDPFNPIKLFFISGIAAALLPYLFSKKLKQNSKMPTSYIFLIFFSIFWIVIASILNESPFIEDLFGTPGRNIGVVLLVILLIIFSNTYIFGSASLIQTTKSSLQVCGYLAIAYGILQFFGFDFFVWEGREAGIQSFFGNQNLASAFFAMFGISLFGQFFSGSRTRNEYFVLSFWFSLSVFLIYQTNSQQGFLMLILGIWVILLNKTFNENFVFKIIFFILSLSSLILLLLDFRNLLPWKSFFYTWTFDQRISFFKSALHIVSNNPLFGTGFGSFENLYKQFRPSESLSLPGASAYTDTAHSILIDLALYGGVILSGLYLIYFFIITKRIIEILKNSSGQESTVIFSAIWIALQFHLNIAQGSIVMYFWSVFLSGLILSKSKLFPKKDLSSIFALNSKTKNTNSEKLPYTDVQILLAIIGFLMGSSLILPLVIVDSRVATNIVSGNVLNLQRLADSFPIHSSRCAFIAETLLVNGKSREALAVSKMCVLQNPNQLLSWKLIVRNPETDSLTKAIATEKWNVLDPLQPPL